MNTQSLHHDLQALSNRRTLPGQLRHTADKQDPGLVPLAERAMTRIAGEPFCRVASDVHPLLNAHPSPMLQSKKLLWLENIIKEQGT